jgi:hypothetical protein
MLYVVVASVMSEFWGLLLVFPLLQCRDFVKAGAEQGQTPSDVILAADITFSCVADPQAAKDVMQLVP